MKTTIARTIAGMTMLLVAVQAHAQDGPLERPAVYDALIRCRTLTDAAARLACFDASSAQLEQATQANQIVIADRETVREAKRGLFGLTLPTIKLFGSGEDEVDEIASTVRYASQVNNRWIFAIESGSRWQQVDTRELSYYPKAGTEVKIRKAAMGGYFANFAGQRGIKVKRVE